LILNSTGALSTLLETESLLDVYSSRNVSLEELNDKIIESSSFPVEMIRGFVNSS